MPRSVIEGGEADEVVALDDLAKRVQEIAKVR
jgi:chemotaxis response regulator CheB